MTDQPCPAPDQAQPNTENGYSPAAMVRQSGRLRSEQQWEIVRQLLHPMLMQNYSGKAIADAFGISVDTAYRWKQRLLEDLRKEAVSMQPRDFVMESVSSLRQVRAEAWAGYHSATDRKEKRAYLNAVTQAESQFARMGERIGLYGRPGQNPLDANAYGEVRDGEQSDMMLVRELQIRLVELLSVSDNEVEVTEDAEPEPYDDLLLEIGAGTAANQTEFPCRIALPGRKRRRELPSPS
ncbi:Homeodomain-like domain-containing protein [Ruegeria halocynthiae]|uniref:Homeodomain-like domain-containing protein n=1 Tax=Ruegeria halocynthiae TaxID=985054 RepID=A0A1H2RDT5_9RHOB|nr:helix-turn-helix domain-containing protein [Ruegeria halocynthiae]SDW17653.1 Homeodomain-like domain-containing protein [Ruegeria halocynthiae]